MAKTKEEKVESSGLPTLLHSVDAGLVHKASAFSAKQDIRYYLNGVHIRKAKNGGSIIEATDGHSLCVLHDEDGVSGDNGSIVDATILPLIPKRGTIKIYSDESIAFDNIKIITGGRSNSKIDNRMTVLEIKKAIIDGVFPDTEKVIPKTTIKGFNINGFNPLYLIKALKSVADANNLGSRRMEGVLIFSDPAENGPVLFCNEKKSVIVVVMSMRIDGAIEKSFLIPKHLEKNSE